MSFSVRTASIFQLISLLEIDCTRYVKMRLDRTDPIVSVKFQLSFYNVFVGVQSKLCVI